MLYTYVLQSGEMDEAVLRAAEHIDAVTFNRIDFEALTSAQQSAVIRAHRELTEFETENAEMLSSPLRSYSINGVSMQFGGDGLKLVSGVIIPTAIYSLLVSTGLCYPAI